MYPDLLIDSSRVPSCGAGTRNEPLTSVSVLGLSIKLKPAGALFKPGFPLEFGVLKYFPFVGLFSRHRDKFRRQEEHNDPSPSTTVSLTLKQAHTSSWSSSETLNQREEDLQLHTTLHFREDI